MKGAKQLRPKLSTRLSSFALAAFLAMGMAAVPGTSQAGWVQDTLKELSFWKEWKSNRQQFRKEWHSYKKETGCKDAACRPSSLKAFVRGKKGEATSVPELDPSGAGAALLLLAGTSLVVAARHRSKTEQS